MLRGELFARHALTAHLPAKALASTAADGTREALAVIYVSEHESLAALELFVHLTPLSPNDRYRSFRLEWEDKLTKYFPVKNLPTNWNAEPPTIQTMQIGDDWVHAGKSVALGSAQRAKRERDEFFVKSQASRFQKNQDQPADRLSVRFASVESLTIRYWSRQPARNAQGKISQSAALENRTKQNDSRRRVRVR